MKWVLVLLIVLGMLPLDVDAKRPRRGANVSIVIDRSGNPAWEPVLRAQIKEFNRAIPKGGPVLRYRKGAPMVCATTVTVCHMAQPWRGYPAFAALGVKNHQVAFSDTIKTEDMMEVACHELMHIYGRLPRDAYRTKRPEQSCNRGWAEHLGTWDRARLRRLYR